MKTYLHLFFAMFLNKYVVWWHPKLNSKDVIRDPPRTDCVLSHLPWDGV